MRNVEWLWVASVGTVVIGKVLCGECLACYRTLIVVLYSDVQPTFFLSVLLLLLQPPISY